jgi:hypothetical protein
MAGSAGRVGEKGESGYDETAVALHDVVSGMIVL